MVTRRKYNLFVHNKDAPIWLQYEYCIEKITDEYEIKYKCFDKRCISDLFTEHWFKSEGEFEREIQNSQYYKLELQNVQYSDIENYFKRIFPEEFI